MSLHETCPTVKVKHPDTEEGYAIINESDLTDEHELFDAPEGKPEGKPESEPESKQRGRKKATDAAEQNQE